MSTFNSSTTTTPNFDNLLLDSLFNRLKIRPPQPPPSTTTTAADDHTLLSSSFEEFLAAHLSDSSFEDSFSDDDNDEDFNQYGDDDDDDDHIDDNDGTLRKKSSRLSKEESRLEKQIVKVILSGNIQTLKPNSGQAVSIGEHHVCVGFHEEDGSGYRVWEWHGHIMLFDDDHGYTPEYIYGNYFERVVAGRKVDSKKKEEDKERDEKKADNNNCGNLGLRELIDDTAQGRDETRVLHRGRNVAVSRVLEGASEE